MCFFAITTPASAAASQMETTRSILLEVAPLLGKGDFKAAYRRLWEAVQENPDDAELNFQLGRAAFEIGRYEAAAGAFERVLIANPDSQRARLELGRTFFQLKSYLLAKEAFEDVLKTNPPKMVADNIRLFLDAIKKQMSPSHLRGRVAAGWMYDSNVGTSPGSDQVSTNIGTFILNSGTHRKVDTAAVTQLALTHSYDPGQQGELSWQSNLFVYNTRYKHHTKYNLDVVTLNSGPAFFRNGYRMELPLTGTIIQLGNEAYGRTWGLSPSIGYSGFKNLDLALAGVIQRGEYSAKSSEARNSDYFSLEFTPRLFLANRKVMIQASTKISGEDAHLNYWSNNGLEGSLGVMLQLPHETSLFVQRGVKKTDYRGREALYDVKRKDHQTRTLVNLSKKLPKGFSVALSYSFTRNHSNLDLYDYDRKQAVALLAWEF